MAAPTHLRSSVLQHSLRRVVWCFLRGCYLASRRTTLSMQWRLCYPIVPFKACGPRLRQEHLSRGASIAALIFAADWRELLVPSSLVRCGRSLGDDFGLVRHYPPRLVDMLLATWYLIATVFDITISRMNDTTYTAPAIVIFPSLLGVLATLVFLNVWLLGRRVPADLPRSLVCQVHYGGD